MDNFLDSNSLLSKVVATAVEDGIDLKLTASDANKIANTVCDERHNEVIVEQWKLVMGLINDATNDGKFHINVYPDASDNLHACAIGELYPEVIDGLKRLGYEVNAISSKTISEVSETNLLIKKKSVVPILKISWETVKNHCDSSDSEDE